MSTLLLVALVLPASSNADAVAPGVTVTVDCGFGGSPSYTSAGFTIPSRGIVPGLGNNGFANRNDVSITTNDVLTITYRNCYSSFSTSYGGQEAAVYTEDCGTFSPTPTTGIVTGLTMTFTYTPLATPASGRTRAYCEGAGGAGSGDHIQYLGDLSPQLIILVSSGESETTVPSTTSSTTTTVLTTTSTTSTTTMSQSTASGVVGVLVNGGSLLKMSKSASAKSIATFAKIKVLSTSKVSLKVAVSSMKFCRVSGTSLKALKVGSCKVTVTVKPKKGKVTSKTITLKVAK